jgi:hypothetical protein
MFELPWCIVGDFNDLLTQEDKRGNHSHPNWLCNGFRTAVSDCDLTDIQLVSERRLVTVTLPVYLDQK